MKIIHKSDVHNDATLDLLGKQAVSHANAGSNIVAAGNYLQTNIRAIIF